MKTLIGAAAASLALLAAGSHARAADFTETYYGQIVSTVPPTFAMLPGQVFVPSDMDVAGLFGGGELQGDVITATFDVDTSLGTLSTGTDYNTGNAFVSLDGGFGFDGTSSSPVTSATFTIYEPTATYTYSYAPDARGQVASEPGLFVANTANSLAGDEAYVGLVTPTAPNGLPSSYTSVTYPNGTAGSYFDPIQTNNAGDFDSISFVTYAVSVTPAPEPSTWALMILGLGCTGALLRRRRTVGLLDA